MKKTQGQAFIELMRKMTPKLIEERYTTVSVYRYRVSKTDKGYDEGWEISPITYHYTVNKYNDRGIATAVDRFSREVYDNKPLQKTKVDDLISLAQVQNEFIRQKMSGKTPQDILDNYKADFEDQTSRNAFRYQQQYAGGSPYRVVVDGKTVVDFPEAEDWADGVIEYLENAEKYKAARPTTDTIDQAAKVEKGKVAAISDK